MDKGHAVSIFLPAVIVGWTLAGVTAGILVCVLTGTDLTAALADIICGGGYAGIILGLFGGVFFLYKTDIWDRPVYYKFIQKKYRIQKCCVNS